MSGAWPQLLVKCARPRQSAERLAEIRALAERCSGWTDLIASGESQGLGPLLYRHVTDSGADVSEGVRRPLRSLYVRHRAENAVRLSVLAEVLDALRAASIPAIVLKGPALIALLYDDAALRPTSDLDLLVPPDESARAESLFVGAGWLPSEHAHPRRRPHHLPVLTAVRDGVPLALELHLDAISHWRRASLRLSRDSASTLRLIASDAGHAILRLGDLLPFSRGAVRGLSLGLEEMMWHTCHHLLELPQQKVLIKLADLVGLAERYADRLDWSRLNSCFPLVTRTLALAGLLDELSAPVARHLPIADRRVRGVGVDYTGWPRQTAGTVRSWMGAARLAGKTVAPPEWWLQLHYGGPKASRLVLNVRHLSATVAFGGQRLREILAQAGRGRRGGGE